MSVRRKVSRLTCRETKSRHAVRATLRLIVKCAALGVVDHLRRRFACFKLGADFLQTGSKRLNLLLLASNSRFLFLVLAVLLEELVEQHCIDRFVADGIDFTDIVVHYQLRTHFSYFLSD